MMQALPLRGHARGDRRPNPWADLYGGVYPESWYGVCASRALAPGASKVVDAFGGSWLVFRTEGGEVRAVSRFCPHMGASLHVGTIRGDRVVCPFHRWEFDGAGVCRRIPYKEDGKIPPKARLATIHVMEHLGWIWIYNGAEPAFQLPDLPEANDRAYTRMSVTRTFTGIHMLQLIENACDIVHLKTIHEFPFDRYDCAMKNEAPHEFSFSSDLIVDRRVLGKPISLRVTLPMRFVGATIIYGEILLQGWKWASYFGTWLPNTDGRTEFHHTMFFRRPPFFLRPLEPLYKRLSARGAFDIPEEQDALVLRDQKPERGGVAIADDWLRQRFFQYYRSHMPGSGRRARESAST